MCYHEWPVWCIVKASQKQTNQTVNTLSVWHNKWCYPLHCWAVTTSWQHGQTAMFIMQLLEEFAPCRGINSVLESVMWRRDAGLSRWTDTEKCNWALSPSNDQPGAAGLVKMCVWHERGSYTVPVGGRGRKVGLRDKHQFLTRPSHTLLIPSKPPSLPSLPSPVTICPALDLLSLVITVVIVLWRPVIAQQECKDQMTTDINTDLGYNTGR